MEMVRMNCHRRSHIAEAGMLPIIYMGVDMAKLARHLKPGSELFHFEVFIAIVAT